MNQICTWKNIQLHNGTTIKDVYNNPCAKMYNCITCDGLNQKCETYFPMLTENKNDLSQMR